MATQMQLKVIFGRKSHGRSDWREKRKTTKTTEVMYFSTLFLMFTLTLITEKEQERVIENKGDEFRSKKKNESFTAGVRKWEMLAASKVKMGGIEKNKTEHETNNKLFGKHIRQFLHKNNVYTVIFNFQSFNSSSGVNLTLNSGVIFWGVILTSKRSLKNSFSGVKMTPDIEELK